MRPLASLPAEVRRRVRFVLTDIDDTLTDAGRLGAAAYGALERLHDAGFTLIPVTGRPAGWCDLIARLWPVDAVVGENGAFYFQYDHAARRMIRRHWRDAATRARDRRRLAALAERILAAVPGAAIAADQAYRETDLAIDHREDVAPLPDSAIERIVALFEAAGASARVSSIHVNGWYGEHDKLRTTLTLLRERFAFDAEQDRGAVAFVGDSPNDAPMFGHFPVAIGVANVADFAGRMAAAPAWVTRRRGGAGFVEVADALLAARP